MGLFTKFKPLTSWTIDELLEEDAKRSKRWLDSMMGGNDYDSSKDGEIESEFLRRGLNKTDELNKKLRTFR
jgi:hypothetical protein